MLVIFPWFKILSNKCILSRIPALNGYFDSTESETAQLSSVTNAFRVTPDLKVNIILNLTYMEA